MANMFQEREFPTFFDDNFQVGGVRNQDDSSTFQEIMEFDTILLWAILAAIIVLVTMCVLSCLRCGRRRHQPGSIPTTSSSIYTVPANYNAVNGNLVATHSAPLVSNNANFQHRRISSVGDRFMVPLDLLPSNFDYTAPGVEYKGDHVVVKDLKLIQLPTNDEYQKQSPYNPNFT